MRGRTIAATLALAFCACEAQAQQQSASTRLLDSFAKCRAVAEAEARAACFDASARALETAVKAKDVTITDAGRAVAKRRRHDNITGPERLPFRVVVGPMASGNVVVKDAVHAHGVLSIDLVREVPEALKPKQIAIGVGARQQALELKPAKTRKAA